VQVQSIESAGEPSSPPGLPLSAGEPSAGGATVHEYISFSIGADQYGVDIMAVREIKGWADITHLPKQPDFVRGILNLRGVLVPIVDLRRRFGEGLTEVSPLHIVIIVQIEGRQIGILGDRVLDIISLSPEDIQPVPHLGEGRHELLFGLATVNQTMIALIDLPGLLAAQLEGSPLQAAS
jgi:purine-binding chemotaxis protein CheW